MDEQQKIIVNTDKICEIVEQKLQIKSDSATSLSELRKQRKAANTSKLQ